MRNQSQIDKKRKTEAKNSQDATLESVIIDSNRFKPTKFAIDQTVIEQKRAEDERSKKDLELWKRK